MKTKIQPMPTINGRNNSKLSKIECLKFFASGSDFSQLSNDDLDEIYFHVNGRLAYHMSREGYINSLSQKRVNFKPSNLKTFRFGITERYESGKPAKRATHEVKAENFKQADVELRKLVSIPSGALITYTLS